MKILFFIFVTLGLSALYLHPGPVLMVEGNPTHVMSDGGDPAGAPFQYAALLKVWQENPSYFLYGAVYSNSLNPEFGAAIWTSWSERFSVVLLSYLLPLEQISTGFVLVLLFATAVSMFLLSRVVGWSYWISMGLAIALAFSAYTRARAKVHMSLSGLYHLPLIFLGLYLVATRKDRKSVLFAAICFLLAATTAHYYVITAAFLAPFFLGFLWINSQIEYPKLLYRAGFAVLPTFLFLSTNFFWTIPSDVKMSVSRSVPNTGAAKPGEWSPYLFVYASRPIDFLTGDISLSSDGIDLNPVRHFLNGYVQDHLDGSNSHERTNGIRWVILFIVGLSFIKLRHKIQSQFSIEPGHRKNIILFFSLGIFGFFLSLNPHTPISDLGPSGWLNSIFNQIRVPSRAGIWVHFSALMIVGYFLSSKINFRLKRQLLFPGVFPLLMILDYPPLIQNLPVAEIQPVSKTLQNISKVNCGVGLHLPYVSIWTDVAFYNFLQKVRGTDCHFINVVDNPKEMKILSDWFPPTEAGVREFVKSSDSITRLKTLASCVPLSWISFDPGLGPDWPPQLCRELGWNYTHENICFRDLPRPNFQKWPSQCGRF